MLWRTIVSSWLTSVPMPEPMFRLVSVLGRTSWITPVRAITLALATSGP